MDRYTRHQLKQDEFQETIDALQVFVSQHLRKIIVLGVATLIVVGGVVGLKTCNAREEAAANAKLQSAITTFNAYVSTSGQNSPVSSEPTFPTAKAKYEKALSEFSEVASRYPRTQAAAYARIHMALCAAQLGNEVAALKGLRRASRASDKQIASQARFALAGELAKTGKVDEAAKIYQDLANHPTSLVPRATALLAMADTYRATNPARAREIYGEVQKEFASDPTIAEILKDRMASLPAQGAAPLAH